MSEYETVGAYSAALDAWLATEPPEVVAATRPVPEFARRVETLSSLMGALHRAGWARYGWPVAVGGSGGTILHRAAMWEALARRGVRGMGPFEHVEILVPTLVEMAQPHVAASLVPEFLAGRARWSQGFSEPGAGSDLASIRTRAVEVAGGYRVNGRKIWTSWAAYARWCLVLARTGTAESRHRGLTAFVVDLQSDGVEVRAVAQANGTDELAEVTFDDVFVPADRVVGAVDGGWAVAMSILGSERGSFAWFRHCFLYRQVFEHLEQGSAVGDRVLGEALLDLVAVTATSHAGLRARAGGTMPGPRSAFTKLLLCQAEQSVHEWILASDADLGIGPQDDLIALQRQDYLFSRIVTVYGGSQQMQLETIAKQVLHLP